MKVTMIDLRPYGYTVQEHEGGYIYCPWMPFQHETEEELNECIKRLEEEYKEKLKGV
jgi:hypothetical protein